MGDLLVTGPRGIWYGAGRGVNFYGSAKAECAAKHIAEPIVIGSRLVTPGEIWKHDRLGDMPEIPGAELG